MGCGSFTEYVGRLFGYTARFVMERVRVARALEDLPVLAAALREGKLTWSAVRELVRVAVPETEAAWLAAARNQSVHDIERAVSGLEPGARPGDPPKASARRHVVRFELSADTWATLREAQAALIGEAGGALAEDQQILLMARRVLGGPPDEGRASYQVQVNVCAHCSATTQQGRGEPVPVPPDAEPRSRDPGALGPGDEAPPDRRDGESAHDVNGAPRGSGDGDPRQRREECHRHADGEGDVLIQPSTPQSS